MADAPGRWPARLKCLDPEKKCQEWQAKGRQQMALREAQLLLLALDAHSAHKAEHRIISYRAARKCSKTVPMQSLVWGGSSW